MGSLIAFLVVIGLAIFGIESCTGSDWYKADMAKQHAKQQADMVPRIVSSSADGCEVYAFNPGDRWRYFTRCSAQTTTDNSFTVTHSSGKTSTTETVDDAITTESKK